MELDEKEKREPNNIVESSTSSVEDLEFNNVSKLPELTRRQLATIYIVCFVNFLKYMDRFTIAGTHCSLTPNRPSFHTYSLNNFMSYDRLNAISKKFKVPSLRNRNFSSNSM